jgi:hypothetical protein
MASVMGAFLLDFLIKVVLFVPRVVVMVLYDWLAGLRRKAIAKGITFRDVRLEASSSTNYPYIDISFVVDSNTTANLSVRRFILPIFRASWEGHRVEVTPRWDGVPGRLPARQNTGVSFSYRPPISFWLQDIDTVDIMGGELEAATLWGSITCRVDLATNTRVNRFREVRTEFLGRLHGWLGLSAGQNAK